MKYIFSGHIELQSQRLALEFNTGLHQEVSVLRVKEIESAQANPYSILHGRFLEGFVACCWHFNADIARLVGQ